MEILLLKNVHSTFQNGNFTFQKWRFYISNGLLNFKIGNSTDILESKINYWHFIAKLTVENVEFTDYFFSEILTK